MSLLNAAIFATIGILAIDALYDVAVYGAFKVIAVSPWPAVLRNGSMALLAIALYAGSAYGQWRVVRFAYLTGIFIYFIPYNHELFHGNNFDFLRLMPLTLPFLLFRRDETRLSLIFFGLYVLNAVWAGVVATAGFPAEFAPGVFDDGASSEAGAVIYVKQHYNSLALVGFAIVASVASLRAMLSRQIRAVERIALIDSLSGLWNRRGVDRLLAREVAIARRNQTALAVALLDIDAFKSVNDEHGHSAGDRAIRAISQYLLKALRSQDIIGRWGGDEFLIVLPDCDGEALTGVLQRVVEGTAKWPIATDVATISVTVSIGAVAATKPVMLHPEKLVNAVDDALIMAKKGGRNRYVVADQESASVLGGARRPGASTPTEAADD